MATALTLSATNPLANPLKASNYGIRRKHSIQADGASVYHHKSSYHPPSSPLAKHAYTIPSPVLVVKPAYAPSPRTAKPKFSSSPVHPKPSFAAASITPAVTTPVTPTISVTTPTTTPTARATTHVPTNPLRLSYVEALKATENIKQKEIVLVQLQSDLANKIKLIETGKEELEQFRIDFEESLRQRIPSPSTVQKSAAVRMREEQEKKKLRAAWRNNNDGNDPVQQTRRNILVAQEDVAALNLRIVNLKKELARMKDVASKELSAKQIMRNEKQKREEMQKKGIQKPKAEPRPKPPPAAPVLRSHQTRMAEQQAIKAKAKAARMASSVPSSASSSSSSQCP